MEFYTEGKAGGEIQRVTKVGWCMCVCRSIQKILGSNPSWILDFFRGFVSRSFTKNISIHESLLSFTVTNIKLLILVRSC